MTRPVAATLEAARVSSGNQQSQSDATPSARPNQQHPDQPQAWPRLRRLTPRLAHPLHRRRLFVMLAAGASWLALANLAAGVFWHLPLARCPWCKYLTCLPLLTSLCDSLEVDVTRRTECISIL
ncbi:unnamed protein product [Protopolystoma xenopodis]|uniref:Uncharacterized protein n=1 Tax=Protopolystoma xenopodis TaxID=117903 RepID=A0A3S5BP96_9PLAT|nr:unnamed protein product [Protopolystoma xenopodis]